MPFILRMRLRIKEKIKLHPPKILLQTLNAQWLRNINNNIINYL